MADDGDYEVEAVSDQEKLAIATHMLMSSPPGQFSDVLTDVRKLLPGGLLDDARAADVAKAYNAQEGVVVQVGDHGVVLAAEGSLDGVNCRDTLTGGAFAVNHTSAEVTAENVGVLGDEGEMAADPSMDQHRCAIEAGLGRYRASFFSGAEKSAACVFAKEGTLVAYVSAHKYNIRNWWTGSWSGRYEVAVGGGSVKVSGAITVRGHYFENGNIQLQTSKQVTPKTITFADSASLSDAVTGYIRESESALHEGLENMYERMGDVTLRSMRRTKPITADRFSWNIAQIRMRNTLTQNSTGK